MKAHLRIARPTDHLGEIAEMYQVGLGFELLGRFTGHDGFDGVMLGHRETGWHLEFTHHRGHSVGKAPTQDHLLVFYIAEEPLFRSACEQVKLAGFRSVSAYNPYWELRGKTFEDLDGYRVVLHLGRWPLRDG